MHMKMIDKNEVFIIYLLTYNNHIKFDLDINVDRLPIPKNSHTYFRFSPLRHCERTKNFYYVYL